MLMENFLKINKTAFEIESATFQFFAKNNQFEYDCWNFDIFTLPNEKLTYHHILHGSQPSLRSEFDPVPLINKADLTDTILHLKENWDSEINEPYFTLYIYEHGDIFDTKIEFLQKKENFYLINIQAKIPADVIFKNVVKLHIHTWIEQLPTQS